MSPERPAFANTTQEQSIDSTVNHWRYRGADALLGAVAATLLGGCLGGDDVTNGQTPSVTSVSPGAECANSGVKIQLGSDAPVFLCNGQSVSITPLSVGDPHCANGGQAFQVGTGPTSYACNGTDGANGQSVAMTALSSGDRTVSKGARSSRLGGAAPIYICSGATGPRGPRERLAPPDLRGPRERLAPPDLRGPRERGATGPSGATGATGATGRSGARGDWRHRAFGGHGSDWRHRAFGATGATGATGPSGATGATGADASCFGVTAPTISGVTVASGPYYVGVGYSVTVNLSSNGGSTALTYALIGADTTFTGSTSSATQMLTPSATGGPFNFVAVVSNACAIAIYPYSIASVTWQPCTDATQSDCVLSAANSGETATGSCASGYSGACSFACNAGTWTQVTNTCAANPCTGATQSNCVVSAANSGETATGSCASGYSGACSYSCSAGTWTQVANTCAANPCTGATQSHCVLSAANSGETATGSCGSGYSGACSYSCSAGTWTQVANSCVSSGGGSCFFNPIIGQWVCQ